MRAFLYLPVVCRSGICWKVRALMMCALWEHSLLLAVQVCAVPPDSSFMLCGCSLMHAATTSCSIWTADHTLLVSCNLNGVKFTYVKTWWGGGRGEHWLEGDILSGLVVLCCVTTYSLPHLHPHLQSHPPSPHACMHAHVHAHAHMRTHTHTHTHLCSSAINLQSVVWS